MAWNIPVHGMVPWPAATQPPAYAWGGARIPTPLPPLKQVESSPLSPGQSGYLPSFHCLQQQPAFPRIMGLSRGLCKTALLLEEYRAGWCLEPATHLPSALPCLTHLLAKSPGCPNTTASNEKEAAASISAHPNMRFRIK